MKKEVTLQDLKDLAQKITDKGNELCNCIECNTCGDFFDPASLKEVFKHEHKGIELEKDIKGVKR